MENKQLNASQKIQKTSQEVNDVKNGVKDGISAVKNYKTGNYVQAAKDAVKVLKNKELRKHVIISSIAGILIPILILLLIAGGFMVVINGIGDRVTSVVSTMGQFISGTGNWFTSLFDSDSGKLIININEEKFDELKNNLRSQGINPEASNLTDECLKLFLLAQYHTQYPEDVIIKIEISDQEKQKIEKRGRGNKLVSENGKNYLKAEGCIKLKRPEFASGNLKYVEKETLDKYVSGEKSFDDVKGKYSISSSGNIIIPERTIEKYIEGEDELQPEMLDFNQEDDFNWDNFNTRRPTEENETPSLKEIPYQSVISSYTMPFEFLTLLTTFTQNSEYGVAVAELVNSKSNIKLNILDNSKTTEERYTYQYMSHSTIHYRVGAEIKTIGPGAWGRTGTASEPYNGNLDEFVSEEKRWNPEIQNYEIFKPHVYRENTIKTEYTSSIQLEEAETWLLKKNSSYNTEEIEPHLDENIENNPQISDVAPRERIKASIDPNQYESLQDVYDSNEDFKNFVDKYYNRDTGKNGINDLRRDLLDGYDRSTMESFVDEDIEEDLMRKFYEQELHLPYPSDASIFPLPENLRQAYENLLRIIEDYKSRSNNWKIDNNSYDVMPTFISNMMENQQKKTAFYVSEKKYNVTNAGEAEDNTNAFIELLVKSVGNQKKYVYYNTESGGEKAPVLEMLSGPDMLFEIIANNEKTANMENAMRYILYKISGKDFGVTEFDFSVYGQASSVGGIPGGTIQERVWYTLRSAGFSEYATAGVMGNIEIESAGFNPESVEWGYSESDIGAGVGLCGWTNAGRGTEGNRTQLNKYAASKGVSWKDANTQIEFLVTQLNRGEGPAQGYATFIGTAGIYGCNMDGWLNATSVADATKQFCGWYERPGEGPFYSSMPKRISAAERYYNQFKGRPLSSFVTSGSGGTIIECAERIHAYMEQNGYFYSLDVGLLKRTFEESKSTKAVCCATYVAWVLIDAGYLNADEMSHGAPSLARIIENKGFTRVNSDQMQAGDIMCYSGHIEIYAGNGQIYNAGSDSAISNAAPSNQWNTPNYALRAPK